LYQTAYLAVLAVVRRERIEDRIPALIAGGGRGHIESGVPILRPLDGETLAVGVSLGRAADEDIQLARGVGRRVVALQIVVDAKPDILNHNLETIPRLYRIARPGGRYERALRLLRRAKEMDATLLSKSGLMCGLGEEWDELVAAMRDLRAVGVDILTLGQYLQPTKKHTAVARYLHPDEFAELHAKGMAMGFRHVESGPLVRSSYHAERHVE